MTDSKEKEHRISNLKNMINNIKDEGTSEEPYEDIEEDSELINYLNEDTTDYETLGIDDEYIYHPGDDDSSVINLEENPINEDFIIKTPKTEENEENNNLNELEELNLDIGEEISDNFDNVINAKIGGKPILAIISTVLGIILIILSIFILQSRSERVIDNVVAGESHFLFIIFLIIGLLFLMYGVYKLFNMPNPFEDITESMESIEKNKPAKKENKKSDEESLEKPLQKSNIPLNKESYKIGEFKINDLKKSLQKPDSEKNIKKDESSERKDLITKEIEEIEYEKAKLEGESIDEIFAEIEDDTLSDDNKK